MRARARCGAATLARRFPEDLFPWLTAPARRELIRAWAADEASEPLSVPTRIRKLRGRRWAELGLGSLELLADDAGAHVAHPLLSREFGAAVAAAGGRLGFESRTAALLALFGELLPVGAPVAQLEDVLRLGVLDRPQPPVRSGMGRPGRGSGRGES